MSARLLQVSHRFGARWALARLSFEIPTGACVLLTGENGAGKTTLLRVLATAIRPSRGKLELFGLPASENLDVVRSRLGVVTHQNYLYDTLSARENLELSLRLAGMQDRLSQVRNALEHVSLERHERRSVGGFSAGMKRRLCFARLLLTTPELALLDEPFGQLDPAGVTLVEDLIRELRQQGTTMVISTHDIERGMALCDSHLKLSGGRQQSPITPIRRITATAAENRA